MANETLVRRLRMTVGAALGVCALAIAYQAGHAGAITMPLMPPPATYTGTLMTFGQPDNSTHSMALSLFVTGANDGGWGSAACTVPAANITCVNGQFTIPLTMACMTVVQQNVNIQVELMVDTVLLGMGQVTPVPYAVEASALNGVLPIANGGTGSSTQNFTTPSQVILNQTTAESANFNISGNGVVGGTLGVGVQSPGAALEIAGDIRLDGTGGAWNQTFAAANGWSLSGRSSAVRYFGLTVCVDFSLTRSAGVTSGLVATGLPPAANPVFFSAYGWVPGYTGLGMYIDTSGNLVIESAGAATLWAQGGICYPTSVNPY